MTWPTQREANVPTSSPRHNVQATVVATSAYAAGSDSRLWTHWIVIAASAISGMPATRMKMPAKCQITSVAAAPSS